MKATVLDLRRRMREVLDALERKESVTISHRGKVKGVIYPKDAPPRKYASLAEHPAVGMWKDREDMKDVEQYVRQIRRGRGHAL
ncbi:MAG: type II toxin-antitoxin system prevent-host-death family antitoxin [Pirellulales bacterium]|nr:type II toxin-antitoxin system prevent-host-death family antitoxin [Pirellulales bacterium]